jgi:hypothetical protein
MCRKQRKGVAMNTDELIKICEFMESLEYMRTQKGLHNIKKINNSEFEINFHLLLDNKDIYEKFSSDLKKFSTNNLIEINVSLTTN